MAIERTLVLIKPPISGRIGCILEILCRYTRAGLKPIRAQEQQLWDSLFFQIYGEHQGKKFFHLMRRAYLDQKFIAICFEGENAISLVRELNGATDPRKAEKGTIRYDFGDHNLVRDGLTTPYNAVHGSDSPESAVRELKLFFPEL